MPDDADKLYLYEKFAPFGAIHSVKVRPLTVCVWKGGRMDR